MVDGPHFKSFSGGFGRGVGMRLVGWLVCLSAEGEPAMGCIWLPFFIDPPWKATVPGLIMGEVAPLVGKDQRPTPDLTLSLK